MTVILKQSTSVTIKFGPGLDKDDGVTPETGLATAMDDATTGIRLSKNGGNLVDRNSATAPVHDEGGYYDVVLDATDTGTLGTLRVLFSGATVNLPIWQDFHVVTANVYDSMFSTDKLEVDAVQLGGDTQSATDLKDFADAGYDPATNKVQGVVTVDTATAVTTVNGLAADAITATSIAADAGTEIANAVWNLDLSDPGPWPVDSAGGLLELAAIDPLAQDVPGSYTGIQSGKVLGDILADTGTDGVAVSATSVRTAVGLASANLDTQLSTIDTVVDKILKSSFIVAESAITTASHPNYTLTTGPGNDIANVLAIFFDASATPAESPIIAEGSYEGSTKILTLNAAISPAITTSDTVTMLAMPTASTISQIAQGILDESAATHMTTMTLGKALNELLGNNTEPGIGLPTSSESVITKIAYLYKNWFNRKTQTATTWSLYNDDAITVDQKATVSDNGTTAEKTSVISGA